MRNNVHDVTIAFDDKAFRDFNAAIGGDAANIIAAKVKQHQMLRDLLLVGE